MRIQPCCHFRKRVPAGALWLYAAIAWFGLVPFATAATTCVVAGDSVGLQAALAAAATNGEDDLIELQAGEYPMLANFVLGYTSAESRNLVVEGGYSEFFGNDCGLPPASPDARSTVLDHGLWRLQVTSGSGSITLRGVTLQNTFSSDASHAPVEITVAGATGTIAIENAILLGNGSTGTSAISLSAGPGAISVANSLFASNVTFAAINPIRFRSTRNGSVCALLINSTFAASTSTDPAVYVTTPNCSSVIANDIFWGNTPGGDVVFENPASTFVLASDLSNLADATGTQSLDLVSLEPEFNPDYSLQDFSPLRNKGDPGGGGSIFSPGEFDVAGQSRTYHAERPDIGAFEIQDVILAYDFDIDFDP